MPEAEFPLRGWDEEHISWEAKGKAVGGLPASQEGCQEQLCQGMVLLWAEELGAEPVMAWPVRWSWQRSSSRDSRQPQCLITSSKGAGHPGHVFQLFCLCCTLEKVSKLVHVTVTSSFCHTNTSRSNYATTQLLHARGEWDSKHRSYDVKTIAALRLFCRLFA